jgi:hypothetical protein
MTEKNKAVAGEGNVSREECFYGCMIPNCKHPKIKQELPLGVAPKGTAMRAIQEAYWKANQ